MLAQNESKCLHSYLWNLVYELVSN